MNLEELTGGTTTTKPWLTMVAASVNAGALYINGSPVVPANSIALASSGGSSLIVDGVGPDLEIKGLAAGSGITITESANSITIAATSAAETARADATSYAVSSSGTRNLWTGATGQGANMLSSQAYIPSINRIVAGGNGTGIGAYYSDDGGATWVASATPIASSGSVGYSPSLGVVTWRAGSEVRTSSDNGVTYTLRPPFAASSGILAEGPILWASFLGLFVASDGSSIATSPDGITWTLRPSASRPVRRVIAVGTTLVACGTAGQMTSVDGINWVNTSATPTIWCEYSPELAIIAFSPSAFSSTMYVSSNLGVGLTALAVKPDTAIYRGFIWSSTLGGFIMLQSGFVVNEINAYLWTGDSRPFAGGLANGYINGSGSGGGGTAVYTIYEYPAFRRLNSSINAPGAVYTCQYLQTTASIAASGSGSLSGQALFLAAGPVQPIWANSKSQLYLDSATSELRHRFNNINYPIAGVNVRKTSRFDATLSQTFYNDGVIQFSWDGVNKQTRLQIAVTPWFSATGFEATQYFSFSAVAPLTQASEGLAYIPATNYYLSSAAVARTATMDMNKITPMTMNSSVWPSTGSTSTTPYYDINIRLSPGPGFAGNYTVQKVYTP